MKLEVGKTYKMRPNIRYHYLCEYEIYGYVPIKVRYEYEWYYVVTVEPHINKRGFGLSYPYNLAISKHEIKVGETVISII